MIIENPDAFKTWLTSILEPLCDADPAALAKYVYALVKKDKPLDELREGMLDQLDVFLQQETKRFVDMLFKALDTQDYLKGNERKQPSPAPAETAPEPEREPEPENQASNGTAEDHRQAITTRGRSPTGMTVPRHRVVVSRAPTKAAPPAPAPRAPPHEHTLVKVLPLNELLEEPLDQPPRRRDRRPDMVRDKEERRRRRSRSWERRARRRYPRTDEERRHDIRRPLSRSPSPRGRYRNRSPPPAVVDRQTSRSRSRSPVPVRERDHERERDRLRVPREMERDRMSRDREHRDRLSRSRDRERSRERSRDRSRGSASPHTDSRIDHSDGFKRRCRDYDEKGYCMRGDLCQWDHGSDPVVLEDAALTRVLTIPPAVPEYNPLTPDIWCGAPGYAPYPAHPHPPRELIPIPRVRDVPPLGATAPPAPPTPALRHPLPNKKIFDYNRLGPPRPPLSGNAINCSLQVKKVPRGLNDITHLNNHFSKFGKIVNIQVCFEGDPEAALITFSNHTEASVAYKSTEAVLNNRFIKVFWYNPDNKQENTPPGGVQTNKQAERPSSQHPASQNKVLINRDNIKATADNKQQQQQQQQQQNDKEKAKDTANGEEQTKKENKQALNEKSKQVVEMSKRAQALLEKQLQQQMLLIQRLETGNVTGAQKTALMEAINSAQEGIEKLRKELVAYNRTLRQIQVNANKKPKTREEAQKEILDAELDMFTKQQEGQDVTELVKKIAELRRQMAIHFPSHPASRRPHSRGGRFNTATRFTRGAPTPKVFVNQSVDHRPRALLISGFEPDDLDALVTHFSQFGEVTGKEVNLSVPELVLQYRARAHAEHAAARGKNYNDRTLSITWVPNSKAITPVEGGAAAAKGEASPPAPAQNGDSAPDSGKELETSQDLTEDSLLRFDEEEDEEEDRSWRR